MNEMLSLRGLLAWKLALICWKVGQDDLGDHFEDVAWCGKRWFGGR